MMPSNNPNNVDIEEGLFTTPPSSTPNDVAVGTPGYVASGTRPFVASVTQADRHIVAVANATTTVNYGRECSSRTMSTAQPSTTAPELEAVQSHNPTNILQLEIPPGYKLYEDMEDAIKGSLKDDDPPLQAQQIAEYYEEMENEKKGTKKELEMIEESETPMPTIPSSSPDIQHPPTAPPVLSESHSPQAALNEIGETPLRRGQRQAVVVIHCPPQSMTASPNDEASTPSIPLSHEEEATLGLNEPVYDAVPIPNEPDDDDTPLLQWKRQLKCIYRGIVSLFVGPTVAVVIFTIEGVYSKWNETLGSNSVTTGEQQRALVAVFIFFGIAIGISVNLLCTRDAPFEAIEVTLRNRLSNLNEDHAHEQEMVNLV